MDVEPDGAADQVVEEPLWVGVGGRGERLGEQGWSGGDRGEGVAGAAVLSGVGGNAGEREVGGGAGLGWRKVRAETRYISGEDELGRKTRSVYEEMRVEMVLTEPYPENPLHVDASLNL